MAKNVIIGQSGGPTAVINSSLAGVYKAACSLGADKVYGMKYGIEGLLKEELIELNVLLDDRMSIELLKRTPSSYLGSCRFKLPDPDTDATPFVKLFNALGKAEAIGRPLKISLRSSLKLLPNMQKISAASLTSFSHRSDTILRTNSARRLTSRTGTRASAT